MNTNQTTTKTDKKRRKPPATTGSLKLILAAGAVIATMIGADLLAAQEQTPAIVQLEPDQNMTVVIPEMENNSFSSMTTTPIKQLSIPQPIAKSKSST
ncbi:MAG: hypothetical protein GY796_15640 [Chloroflexi bacterium]|nr:hypothetical protein [Chloroflexota bacterium]